MKPLLLYVNTLCSLVLMLCKSASNALPVLNKAQIRSHSPLNPSNDRLIMLASGMATQLSSKDQANMRELFLAFAENDSTGLAKATLKFSGQEQTCPNPEAFVAAVNENMAAINVGGSEVRGAEALSSLLDVIRQHKVWFLRHYASCSQLEFAH